MNLHSYYDVVCLTNDMIHVPIPYSNSFYILLSSSELIIRNIMSVRLLGQGWSTDLRGLTSKPPLAVPSPMVALFVCSFIVWFQPLSKHLSGSLALSANDILHIYLSVVILTFNIAERSHFQNHCNFVQESL